MNENDWIEFFNDRDYWLQDTKVKIYNSVCIFHIILLNFIKRQLERENLEDEALGDSQSISNFLKDHHEKKCFSYFCSKDFHNKKA